MQTAPPSSRPYLRTPAISPDGRRLVFVYADDVWIVPASGGDAERLTAYPARHSHPIWAPDGRRIAFSSGRTGTADLYTLPLDGGEVERLTYHDLPSTPEAWSRDGRFIFFRSSRDWQESAIYRVDVGGGTPVPWLSQPYEPLAHLAVSPDGERLAFNVTRDSWWRRGPNRYGGAELWTVGAAAGAADFRRLSAVPGLNRWPCWDAEGAGVYVVSDRDGVENLWYIPLDGSEATRVTSFADGRVMWPTISGDGRTIVFERDFAIWRLDVVSGQAEPLAIHVRADTKARPPEVANVTRELSELTLSPDGKKVAFVAHGEVFADFADKETDREQRLGASFRVTSTPARERDVAWGPDSRRLVYTSDRHGDEEIYTYDFASRAETRLTHREGRKSMPTPSPDGQWIAYAAGDDEIRLLRAETGEDQPFVRADLRTDAWFAWSPDSAWLVFTGRDSRSFSNLYVQRVGEREAQQITWLSNTRAERPLWAPNGRFIVFTTGHYFRDDQMVRVDLRPPEPLFRESEFEKLFEDRAAKPEDRSSKGEGASEKADRPGAASEASAPTETPAPEPKQKAAANAVEIVFAGIERRLRFLTTPQLAATALTISPDSRDLIFHATVAGKQNLWTMALDEPRADAPPRQLTTSGHTQEFAQFTPDGKAFLLVDGRQVFVRKFTGNEQTPLPLTAEVLIDFQQEKLQVFDESWRLLRDSFYDPTFRGLDWSVARAQFAPLAAGAQTADDLHTVINLMIGELRASHLGVHSVGHRLRQDGYTGLLFDRVEQARSGRLVVAGLVPESPAALSGAIAPGDELIAVDGHTISPDVSLDALLQRTAGRRVALRLRAAGGAEREVALRPASADQYDTLRYRGWVYANEAYVHEVSGGRLGYVHIRRMDYPSYKQLIGDLDAEAYSREGIVVDTRYNSGGFTATFILDVLARRSVLLSAYRSGVPLDAGLWHGNRVLNKPTVLITNEKSASNTEMFAESYRRLGLGKVVGRPTAGAVIGTSSHQLLNGAIIKLPRYKVATRDGEDLEGTGRTVDVDVPLPPGEGAGGRDRQLDAAVRTLLAQIDGDGNAVVT